MSRQIDNRVLLYKSYRLVTTIGFHSMHACHHTFQSLHGGYLLYPSLYGIHESYYLNILG